MNELWHYGVSKRDGAEVGSGRYPLGSGEEPFQRNSKFLDDIDKLKEEGLTDTEIAKALGYSTTEFRERRKLEREEYKLRQYTYAINLRNQGFTNVAIGEKLGIPESSVRNLLKDSTKERLEITGTVAKKIQDATDEQMFIDIGSGSEKLVGVSPQQFKAAVRSLTDKGYHIHYMEVEQAGIPGQYTSVKILVRPDVSFRDYVVPHRDEIGDLDSHQMEQLYSNDRGKTILGIEKPTSVDSNRIMVRYGDEGGREKDGVIELRRGVEDLNLGNASYAQVRIAVDGTHYLKGMALYSDNMPDGVDIIFNTNKSSDVPKMKVFKEMKTNSDGTINWDNPFGSTLRMEDGVIVGQSHYISKDGKDKLSPINIVREEGDWSTWSKTLSAQFLSKQPKETIKQQLDLTYERKLNEYEEIDNLTLPEVKKRLLISFADDCDSSASHLKAVSMPRQESKVILPIEIPSNQVYAPSFKHGEEVVLIRYPHGGTFEIPVLTVNNRSKSGISILGKQPVDAIGISSKTAEQLSGADFDGDTVVVIPTRGQKISATAPLQGLKNFDPKASYGASDIRPKGSYKLMTESQKQQEMGKVSNLITDMTIKGAPPSEIVRAVRHSMVVIDAVKHELDYEASYRDNGIAELKTKYQGGPNRGAATLISRANSDARVKDIARKQDISLQPKYQSKKLNDIYVDKEGNEYKDLNGIWAKYDKKSKDYISTGVEVKYDTHEKFNKPSSATIFKDGKKYKDIKGEWNEYDPSTKSYIPTGNKVRYKRVKDEWYYYDKSSNKYIPSGKQAKSVIKDNTTKTTKMQVVDDAYKLSSGTQKENIYANYANKLKALANQARKEAEAIGPIPKSSSAAELYSKEVASLNASLNVALKNSIYERKAQLITDVIVKAKLRDNPDMDDDELKKIRTQALAEARARTGASKRNTMVNISDREWEAINARALSSTKITQILNNADLDKIKQRATPRNDNYISNAQLARLKNMARSGYSQSEIAEALGISASAVSKYLKE